MIIPTAVWQPQKCRKIMEIVKGFFIVGLGSFIGGGLRFLVAKAGGALFSGVFPVGTFVVNILGCLIIGFLSGLSAAGGLSPQSRLFLTTGFCGGFTTFSTFMNENATLLSADNYLMTGVYMVASLAVGLLCVWAGNALAKLVA